jgi:hypothetical protein
MLWSTGERFENVVWKVLIMNDLNVNREHTTSDNQDTPGNHLAEMSCENNSRSSLNSDHSQFDESEDPDSLQEDDSDAQSYTSGLDSVEADTSCNSGDGCRECIGQVVRVFCL